MPERAAPPPASVHAGPSAGLRGASTGRSGGLLLLALLAAPVTGCKPSEPAPAGANGASTSGAPASGAPASAAESRPAGPLGEATLDQAEALEQANAALARGDTADGRRRLEQVIAGPPSAARTSALLALAYSFEATDPAAAARWYDRLVDEAPLIPEVWFALGRFRGAQGEREGAITAFQQALRLAPDLLPVYPLLGALLLKAEKRQEVAELMTVYERRLEALVARVKSAETPLAERLPVVELFALLDDERGQQTLVALLSDARPELRVAAASALAELGEPEGLAAIAEATLAEKDGVARELLTQALARARRRVSESTP